MKPPAGHGRARWILAGIVLIGFALRLANLLAERGKPTYAWGDPEGYVQNALLLTQGGWHWTWDVVRFLMEGREHALPPLFPCSSRCSPRFRGFHSPRRSASSRCRRSRSVLTYFIAQSLHSVRAGLVAAGITAIWAPGILGAWAVAQEAVYIPLVMAAFVLLIRAMAAAAGFVRFALAGMLFALAALTRSMPMFFVVPAALMHVAFASNRRLAIRQGLALIVGFTIVAGPYIILLSLEMGRFTPIDSHGSLGLIRTIPYSGGGTPSLVETLGLLARAIVDDPATYFTNLLARMKAVFQVNGGRMLEIFIVPETKTGAWAWKGALHLGLDLPLVVACVLAPIGLVLVRQKPAAVVLASWAILNLVVSTMYGFGTPRFRAPFEFALFAFAAVVAAGGWQPARWFWWVPALGVSFVLAFTVLPQVPRSLNSYPDYGVRWPDIILRRTGEATGRAGFNVPAYLGRAELWIGNPAPPGAESRPVRVDVRDPVTSRSIPSHSSPAPSATWTSCGRRDDSPTWRSPRQIPAVNQPWSQLPCRPGSHHS